MAGWTDRYMAAIHVMSPPSLHIHQSYSWSSTDCVLLYYGNSQPNRYYNPTTVIHNVENTYMRARQSFRVSEFSESIAGEVLQFFKFFHKPNMVAQGDSAFPSFLIRFAQYIWLTTSATPYRTFLLRRRQMSELLIDS